MADWSAVRSAIASLCKVSGIKESTSTATQGVGQLPAVKITHVESLSISDYYGTGGRGAGFEARMAKISGELLLNKPGTVGAAMINLEPYMEALYVAFRTGFHLGLSYVQDCWLDSVDAGQFSYGGADYPGAKLTFFVVVRESVTRVA